MEHICESCGYNYKDEGIEVELTGKAVWNETTQRYEVRRSFMSDEMKCPNCYSYADETVFYVENE